eukprot:CAMPEP_0184692456 /NCGR_PEP_ID=MMETSP0313-20130426/929_1 /TAXON_ID=2792 /ORGANISM="Porphyridium aerugineum, Strain SAG 1380-2" /LENGTH=1385 /DNA_ID=CAMNT_0027150289 /DNA_START=685 /DNA_END=4842 /DNA_ORIENTATION=+
MDDYDHVPQFVRSLGSRDLSSNLPEEPQPRQRSQQSPDQIIKRESKNPDAVQAALSEGVGRIMLELDDVSSSFRFASEPGSPTKESDVPEPYSLLPNPIGTVEQTPKPPVIPRATASKKPSSIFTMYKSSLPPIPSMPTEKQQTTGGTVNDPIGVSAGNSKTDQAQNSRRSIASASANEETVTNGTRSPSICESTSASISAWSIAVNREKPNELDDIFDLKSDDEFDSDLEVMQDKKKDPSSAVQDAVASKPSEQTATITALSAPTTPVRHEKSFTRKESAAPNSSKTMGVTPVIKAIELTVQPQPCAVPPVIVPSASKSNIRVSAGGSFREFHSTHDLRPEDILPTAGSNIVPEDEGDYKFVRPTSNQGSFADVHTKSSTHSVAFYINPSSRNSSQGGGNLNEVISSMGAQQIQQLSSSVTGSVRGVSDSSNASISPAKAVERTGVLGKNSSLKRKSRNITSLSASQRNEKSESRNNDGQNGGLSDPFGGLKISSNSVNNGSDFVQEGQPIQKSTSHPREHLGTSGSSNSLPGRSPGGSSANSLNSSQRRVQASPSHDALANFTERHESKGEDLQSTPGSLLKQPSRPEVGLKENAKKIAFDLTSVGGEKNSAGKTKGNAMKSRFGRTTLPEAGTSGWEPSVAVEDARKHFFPLIGTSSAAAASQGSPTSSLNAVAASTASGASTKQPSIFGGFSLGIVGRRATNPIVKHQRSKSIEEIVATDASPGRKSVERKRSKSPHSRTEEGFNLSIEEYDDIVQDSSTMTKFRPMGTDSSPRRQSETTAKSALDTVVATPGAHAHAPTSAPPNIPPSMPYFQPSAVVASIFATKNSKDKEDGDVMQLPSFNIGLRAPSAPAASASTSVHGGPSSAPGSSSPATSASQDIAESKASEAGDLDFGRGWAKDKTFAECVVAVLNGMEASRRKTLFKMDSVNVWFSDNFEYLHWKKKSGYSPYGRQGESLALNTVTKVRNSGNEVIVEYNKQDSVDLLFENKEQAKILFTALSCMTPNKTRIFSRNRTTGTNLANYNILMDKYNGKYISQRKRIDDYILLMTIGRGAFGKVKLAINAKTKLFYAVKVIPKLVLRKQVRPGGNPIRNKSLTDINELREIAIMRKLDHPNVLKIAGVFDDEENDQLFIVLEYMGKGVVMKSNLLEGEKPLDIERAREVFIDTLSGLAYLHSLNIIHRDIKPDNLLTKVDGTVKIADFGTAKIVGSPDKVGSTVNPALSSHKTNVGTPAFLAPELCLSDLAPQTGPDTYAADVWSLGVTLYYMVFGRVPFVANNVFRMYTVVCEQELIFPDTPVVPDSLKDLLAAIIKKDPNTRMTIDEIYKHPWVREGLANLSMRANKPTKPVKAEESAFRITEDDVANAVLSVKSVLRRSPAVS